MVFDHQGKNLVIDTKSFPMEPTFKEGLAQNANHVSIVNVLLTSYPLVEGHYLMKLKNFVDGMLWFRNLDSREFIGLETNEYVLDEYIIKKGMVDAFQAY